MGSLKIRFWVLLVLALALTSASTVLATPPECIKTLSATAAPYPREIDPAKTFDSMVRWIHDELIVKRGAPGLVIGISGTDSIVAFLAAAKAFELAGKPDRVAGVHYGPTEEMIEDNPAAASHLWFQNDVIPWLRKKAPHAKIVVDSSIDFRRDGLRWGALVDWSVIQDPVTRTMRLPQDQYWVVGTRNATEDELFSYSSISRVASVQVLNHLWKSEVLTLSKYLGAPTVAIDRSCEVDCVCGRLQLPAKNIPEVDWLLMARKGVLSEDFVNANIPAGLRTRLSKYIESQIKSGDFKSQIPYQSEPTVIAVTHAIDPERVAIARRAVQGLSNNIKAVTRLVPRLIAEGQVNIASDLVTLPTPLRDVFLPESLVLFNTAGLRTNQKQQMVSSVFAPTQVMSPTEVTDLAQLSARIGNDAFSFTQWRFLTQRYGGKASIAEQFGMQPLQRASDLRDSTLDASNPARDELGRGFVWRDQNLVIEYRRSYILVSDLNAAEPTTLVIRNSSHFFGRDRLANAAYLSLAPHSPQGLQGLSATELTDSGSYVRWQDILHAAPEVPLTEKLRRASRLLDHLDQFNLAVNKWLRASGAHGGAAALIGFLEGAPPLYLGVVERDAPSWRPTSVRPLAPALVEQLRNSADWSAVFPELKGHGRLVLMSGENGDLP